MNVGPGSRKAKTLAAGTFHKAFAPGAVASEELLFVETPGAKLPTSGLKLIPLRVTMVLMTVTELSTASMPAGEGPRMSSIEQFSMMRVSVFLPPGIPSSSSSQIIVLRIVTVRPPVPVSDRLIPATPPPPS